MRRHLRTDSGHDWIASYLRNRILTAPANVVYPFMLLILYHIKYTLPQLNIPMANASIVITRDDRARRFYEVQFLRQFLY